VDIVDLLAAGPIARALRVAAWVAAAPV